MNRQVLADLLVRVCQRHPDRVHNPAHVRSAGRETSDGARAKGRDRDAETTALAGAVHSHACGIDLGQGGEDVETAHGIEVKRAVGVGQRVGDVVDEQSRVAGVDLVHGAQLAARGHAEDGVATERPRLRHHRVGNVPRDEEKRGPPGRWRIAGWCGVPGGDANVSGAGVPHVEHVDVGCGEIGSSDEGG
jgi:hypothetical protein